MDAVIGASKNRIRKLLLELGIDPSVLGYKYLCDAIELAYIDRKYLDKVTKSLYVTIAQNNSTTYSRVERAIRHAIGKMLTLNPYAYEMLPLPARYDNGKYTNSQFIACCVEMLHMEDGENA